MTKAQFETILIHLVYGRESAPPPAIRVHTIGGQEWVGSPEMLPDDLTLKLTAKDKAVVYLDLKFVESIDAV